MLILSINLLWFLNIIIFKRISACKSGKKAEEAEFIFTSLIKVQQRHLY